MRSSLSVNIEFSESTNTSNNDRNTIKKLKTVNQKPEKKHLSSLTCSKPSKNRKVMADLSSNALFEWQDSKRPLPSIRFDGINHFPDIDLKKSATRCKRIGCVRQKTHVYCLKCGVHLCFTPGRNCFLDFHK